MRVLAVCAHPDDMEIQCASTLLKCKERGDEVFVCHMSSGSLGHAVIMPEELKKIRLQEEQNSGAMVGFTVLYGGCGTLVNIRHISMSVGGCVLNTAIDLATIDPSMSIQAIGLVEKDDYGSFVCS